MHGDNDDSPKLPAVQEREKRGADDKIWDGRHDESGLVGLNFLEKILISCIAIQGWLVLRSRLISGFCSSSRMFAPRFFQAPPRGGWVLALAFR